MATGLAKPIQLNRELLASYFDKYHNQREVILDKLPHIREILELEDPPMPDLLEKDLEDPELRPLGTLSHKKQTDLHQKTIADPTNNLDSIGFHLYYLLDNLDRLFKLEDPNHKLNERYRGWQIRHRRWCWN